MPTADEPMTAAECQRRVAELSPQLRQVLQLMAQGHPTKQIADRMGLSPDTVKTYRERVYSRLRVVNMATAIRVAFTARLI